MAGAATRVVFAILSAARPIPASILAKTNPCSGSTAYQ
jgi:hypothetical protein